MQPSAGKAQKGGAIAAASQGIQLNTIVHDCVGKDGVQFHTAIDVAKLPYPVPPEALDFVKREIRISHRSIVHRGGDGTGYAGLVKDEKGKLLSRQDITTEQYIAAVLAYGFRGESSGPTAADKREAKKWIAAKGGGEIEKISNADWQAIESVVKRKFDVTLESRTVEGVEKMCMAVRLASSILA